MKDRTPSVGPYSSTDGKEMLDMDLTSYYLLLGDIYLALFIPEDRSLGCIAWIHINRYWRCDPEHLIYILVSVWRTNKEVVSSICISRTWVIPKRFIISLCYVNSHGPSQLPAVGKLSSAQRYIMYCVLLLVELSCSSLLFLKDSVGNS